MSVPASGRETAKGKSNKYPRRRPLRTVRTVFLFSWVVIWFYFGNGIFNAVQTLVTHPNQLDVGTVVYDFALPGFLASKSIPVWVYILVAALGLIILAGCLWAWIDRTLESRAMKGQSSPSPDQPQVPLTARLIIGILAGLILGILTVPLLSGIRLGAQGAATGVGSLFSHPDVLNVIGVVILLAAFVFLLGEGLLRIIYVVFYGREYADRQRRYEDELERRNYRFLMMLDNEPSSLSTERLRLEAEESIQRASESRVRTRAGISQPADAKAGIAVATSAVTFIVVLILRIHIGISDSASPWYTALQWSTYAVVAAFPLVLTYTVLCWVLQDHKLGSMRRVLLAVLFQGLCSVAFAISLALLS